MARIIKGGAVSTDDGQPKTRSARIAEGRSSRARVSRGKLGEVPPTKRRPGVLQTLEQAAAGRLENLLPVKYARMSASAFAFFRGTVSIMAADLAAQPHTGCAVQLCGDAHLQNMGSFETPDGRIVFDINDFDETIPGPWEWDVKRMAASIALGGTESGHNAGACRQAIEAFTQTYVTEIEELADQPILVAARHVIHRLSKTEVVSAAFQQAQRATPLDLLRKYCEQTARGRYAFKRIDNTLWRVTGSERRSVLSGIGPYLQTLAPDRLHLFAFFQLRDVGFKIVGTGSVGLRDYILLMVGNGPRDPLFLQIKQEVASAYSRYLKHKPFPHQGQRVAEGQRNIQPVSDLLLGWTQIGGHQFLVRQLNDHKGGIDIENLRGTGLKSLAGVAGELLARGHARSGDALAIKGYIGTGDKVVAAITRYAMDYAEMADKDYLVFKKAIERGDIKAAA